MQDQFNPDLRLEHEERALLVQLTAMPGYPILHRIFKAEVDKFIVHLINVPEADDEAVLAAHKLVKAAAQFYSGVTNNINEQVLEYTGAMVPGKKAVDVTEGILDIDLDNRIKRDIVREAFSYTSWEDE